MAITITSADLTEPLKEEATGEDTEVRAEVASKTKKQFMIRNKTAGVVAVAPAVTTALQMMSKLEEKSKSIPKIEIQATKECIQSKSHLKIKAKAHQIHLWAVAQT